MRSTGKLAEDDVVGVVRALVAEYLDKSFGNLFVFNPIVVTPEVDDIDGGKYLRVDIVFDGDQERLDPDRTMDLIPNVRGKLRTAYGENTILCPYFNEKSEWDRYVGSSGPEAG